MSDPADLSVEPFVEVIDCALAEESDAQRLYTLALLGRNEWTYNGARQPFTTLWKFERTLRNNPHIVNT
ncbi:hypothetical protein N7463_003840 [Penicillium fimorum]|uniref:Uncharacterized protein n=1 Tax=Penicillium fimorum TaxID=1882269 RepID=A0A9W9Y221_9EURO|nr:hypothetical protein N7463_003840 [Penicillium fimorum]